MREEVSLVKLTSAPWKLRLVITLITPATASVPYTADAPSVSTSMRSMAAAGIASMLTNWVWKPAGAP